MTGRMWGISYLHLAELKPWLHHARSTADHLVRLRVHVSGCIWLYLAAPACPPLHPYPFQASLEVFRDICDGVLSA